MILTWGLFFMMLEPLGMLQKAGLMQRPRAFLACTSCCSVSGLQRPPPRSSERTAAGEL